MEITSPLEIPGPKFKDEVLENIKKPVSQIVVKKKDEACEITNKNCLTYPSLRNGIFLLEKDNDIPNQIIHFNNMIQKLNEIEKQKEAELSESVKAFEAKHPDKKICGETSYALQEGWEAITTDVHGDLFSMLASYVYAGAVKFVEGDFTYYNVVTGTYYTQEEYDNLKDKSWIYVMPTPHINPNFKGKLINLGDFIDRGPESVQCICIAELLSLTLGPQMINIIGNHEVMLYPDANPDENGSYKSSTGLIKNIIQRGIDAGYFNTCVVIDTGRKNEQGKHIYNSYAHVPFCKKHSFQLFRFVKVFLSEDDTFISKKIKDEDCYKERFSQMKSVWNKQYKKLPDDLKNKIKQIINDNVIPYPNSIECFYSDPNLLLYDKLSKYKIDDVDLFKIKNAVGNSIFYFHDGSSVNSYSFGLYLGSIIGADFLYSHTCDMDWIFGERYKPNEDSLFATVTQQVGHEPEVPSLFHHSLRFLDCNRSSGYHHTHSLAYTFVSNPKLDKTILDSREISREGCLINLESKILTASKVDYSINGPDKSPLKNKKGDIKRFQSNKNKLTSLGLKIAQAEQRSKDQKSLDDSETKTIQLEF